jgi:hypothetical protein
MQLESKVAGAGQWCNIIRAHLFVITEYHLLVLCMTCFIKTKPVLLFFNHYIPYSEYELYSSEIIEQTD